MLMPCGSHYYRIFSVFGSFPAVTCQTNYAFSPHDFQKIKRVSGNCSAGSLIDSFVGLSANWFGKQIGGIFRPNSLTKALGTDACSNRTLANSHLTIHRMWKRIKKKRTAPGQMSKRFTSGNTLTRVDQGVNVFLNSSQSTTEIKFLDSFRITIAFWKHTDEKPGVFPWKVGFIFALVGMWGHFGHTKYFLANSEKRR